MCSYLSASASSPPRDVDHLARAPGGCAQPLRAHYGLLLKALSANSCFERAVHFFLDKSLSSAPGFITHNISAWRMRHMFGRGEIPLFGEWDPTGIRERCKLLWKSHYVIWDPIKMFLDHLLHWYCAGSELYFYFYTFPQYPYTIFRACFVKVY